MIMATAAFLIGGTLLLLARLLTKRRSLVQAPE
jgi:hypothetical protein